MKAWELFAVAFESFPPTKDFEDFLKHYFLKTIQVTSLGNTPISACSTFCLKQLQSNSISQRKPRVLSNNELNQILENFKSFISTNATLPPELASTNVQDKT